MKSIRNFRTRCNHCVFLYTRKPENVSVPTWHMHVHKHANRRRNLVHLCTCITVLHNKALQNTDSIDNSTNYTPHPKAAAINVYIHVHSSAMVTVIFRPWVRQKTKCTVLETIKINTCKCNVLRFLLN